VTWTTADAQPQSLVLRLDSNWHFAPAKGAQGTNEKWYAENFNDTNWAILKSGMSWERQGVVHSGFGCYRQKLFIPKEYLITRLRQLDFEPSTNTEHYDLQGL
jgi:beta-galactosidase/beta-glucuronidase